MGYDEIIKMLDQSQKFEEKRSKVEGLLRKYLNENEHVLVISLGSDDGLPIVTVTKSLPLNEEEFNLSSYLSVILNTSNLMLSRLAGDNLSYSFIKGHKYNVLMYYVGGEYLLGVAYQGTASSQEFTEWAKKLIKELMKLLYKK